MRTTLFAAAAALFAICSLVSLAAPRSEPPSVVAATAAVVEIAPPAAPISRPAAALPRSIEASARTLTSSHSPCVLEGTVRNVHGAPVKEARVTLVDLEGALADGTEWNEEHVTETDAVGHFSIETAPGEFALFATDDEAASALLEPLSLSPGERIDELDLVLSGRAVVSGMVVDDDGDPIAAHVELRLKGQRSLFRDEYTGDEGHFSIENLPDAAFELTADESGGERSARVSLTHSERDLVLRLGRAPEDVTVSVKDARGQPAPDVAVRFVGEQRTITMTTDEQGLAVGSVPSGHYRLTAEDGVSGADPIELDLDGRARDVELVLRARASASGRVLTAEGAPASGLVTVMFLEGPNANEIYASVAITDGSYRIEGLVRGRYELRYASNDEELLGEGLQLELTIVGTEERTLPDLRISAGRHVRGVVLDDGGAPVANTDIDVVSTNEESLTTRCATSDEQGHFDCIVHGSVRVRADGAAQLSAIVLAAGRGDEELTLSLAHTGNIEGVLRGHIATDARVRCSGGLWHDVDVTGQYHLTCPVGSTLEIESGGQTHRAPVEIDEDESTYVELRL